MEHKGTLVAAILMAILVAAWCLTVAWRLGPPPEAVPAGTGYVGHVVGMGDTVQITRVEVKDNAKRL